MKERSLQKDNKLNKRSKGFFDVDPAVEERSAVTYRSVDSKDGSFDEKTVEETASTGKASVKAKSGRDKRFYVIAAVFLSAVVLLTVAAIVLSRMDFIKDSDYNGDELGEEEELPKTVFEIYEPDWETDIFTIPEYLELSPERIEYSDDGGTTTKRVGPEGLEKAGGDKLVFLNSYFDAIKHGDHEALNAMLTDTFIEENGLYEDFPMQKLFGIKVVRMYHNDPAFDNGEYDDYYFIVRYYIYRNDGLFKENCDDQYYCKTIMRVLINDKGEGKIDLVRDYNG